MECKNLVMFWITDDYNIIQKYNTIQYNTISYNIVYIYIYIHISLYTQGVLIMFCVLTIAFEASKTGLKTGILLLKLMDVHTTM